MSILYGVKWKNGGCPKKAEVTGYSNPIEIAVKNTLKWSLTK